MSTNSTGDIMSSTELRSQTTHPAITIRPIRLTDADMEAEFVGRLSPKTKHFRFLAGLKELTPKMLKSFCDVDYHHSMAFVATVSKDGVETEIGVSRYAPNANEDVREMAVTIADDWQHQGIGTSLTEKLIAFARDHGVKTLYSVDLADNTAMRQLAKEIGMSSRRDPEDARQVIYSLTL
jgi:RimJ/RimL family protein N-acetyltransferase